MDALFDIGFEDLGQLHFVCVVCCDRVDGVRGCPAYELYANYAL